MLDITPLTGTFGARVDGFDVSRDSSAVDEIARALGEYKVLVFRDQADLDPADLVRFAACFGTPETAEHPTNPGYPGVPGVQVLVSDIGLADRPRDSWHTDGATRTSPSWTTFLHAVSLPPYGRDTLFADAEAIYDHLSSDLQDFLAAHSALHAWGAQKPDAPPIAHPMVTTNPVTGRRRVYVNHEYTVGIIGLHPEESDLLLQYLFRLAWIPEVQLRVTWEPGTLVMWDNESTIHYLVRDFKFRRVHHRVMVER